MLATLIRQVLIKNTLSFLKYNHADMKLDYCLTECLLKENDKT